ncbi:response regulator [bacterium]|nr:response regulator [bacterium]
MVEDSDADVMAFTRAIRKLAPETKIVRWPNAQDALEAIERGQVSSPDIFFIDLNLPGMSGLEFLRRVRSVRDLKLVPAVVLTTSSDPKEVQQSFLEGAGGHLVKPTGFEQLVLLLQKCLSYWFEATLLPLAR